MATLYALFFNGNTAMRARRRSSVLPRKSNPGSVHLFFKGQKHVSGRWGCSGAELVPSPPQPPALRW